MLAQHSVRQSEYEWQAMPKEHAKIAVEEADRCSRFSHACGANTPKHCVSCIRIFLSDHPQRRC